jgi:hypothetical protein
MLRGLTLRFGIAQSVSRRGLMWPFKRKPRQRFYLLPGMGGKNLRRKRKKILGWSIAVGLFTSAIVVCILYLLSSR